jgi:hypothetical protein
MICGDECYGKVMVMYDFLKSGELLWDLSHSCPTRFFSGQVSTASKALKNSVALGICIGRN